MAVWLQAGEQVAPNRRSLDRSGLPAPHHAPRLERAVSSDANPGQRFGRMAVPVSSAPQGVPCEFGIDPLAPARNDDMAARLGRCRRPSTNFLRQSGDSLAGAAAVGMGITHITTRSLPVNPNRHPQALLSFSI